MNRRFIVIGARWISHVIEQRDFRNVAVLVDRVLGCEDAAVVALEIEYLRCVCFPECFRNDQGGVVDGSYCPLIEGGLIRGRC